MPMELVKNLPYNHPYRWDGRLFGGPRLWRPDQLGSSLALWLDAADPASIILNGSTVSQWSDKSGNARHLTQATASLQPNYLTTGFNGYPTLDFNGVHNLNFPPLSALGTSCSATFVQFTTDINYIIISRPSAVPYSYVATQGQTVVADGVWGSPTGRWIDGASAFPIGSRGDLYTRLNNANRQITYNGIDLSTWTASDLGFGGNWPGLTFTGRIPEVVFTNAALSNADRQRLEGYLAHKWGMETNLPTGHLFRNTPPII